MSRAMVRDGTGGWRHPLSPGGRPRRMAQPTAETRAERRRLRALRLALPRADRVAAERAIVAALRRLRVFRRGRRVAVYLAMPGEVSLAGALADALGSGAEIYVPQVTSRRLGRMRFVRLRRRRGAAPQTSFGIAEPGRRRARVVAAVASRRDPGAGPRLRPRGQPARHGRRLLRPRAARSAATGTRSWRRPQARRHRVRLPGSRDGSSRRPGTWRSTSSSRNAKSSSRAAAPAGTATGGPRVNYWLFKSEPDTFGVDDLARAKDATTAWDGVRNYQVRNLPARLDPQGRPGLLLSLELRRARHRRHRARGARGLPGSRRARSEAPLLRSGERSANRPAGTASTCASSGASSP